MSNVKTVPVCFKKELLSQIDCQVLRHSIERKKGRAFNRSEFIARGMEYYLDKVSHIKINYLKKAEEKLEEVLLKK
jgi:hypothetical protein